MVKHMSELNLPKHGSSKCRWLISLDHTFHPALQRGFLASSHQTTLGMGCLPQSKSLIEKVALNFRVLLDLSQSVCSTEHIRKQKVLATVRRTRNCALVIREGPKVWIPGSFQHPGHRLIVQF